MRITEAHLQGMVVQYRDAITKFTGEVPEIQLHSGSKANGISFRLYHVIRDETGGVKTLQPAWGTSGAVWNDGFIGETKSESYYTLRTIVRSIQAATDYMF